MAEDAIAVIDFGGQYAHLIATKIRRMHVKADILQPEDDIQAFSAYRGIIISGSPSLSSHGEDSAYNKQIFDLPTPILGFCFGHQEIAKHYGGTVIHGQREWGPATLQMTAPHVLFDGLDQGEPVWMSHFDSVVSIGPEFQELATSSLVSDVQPHRFAAIGSDSLQRYGFQFHPEVDDTPRGDVMIGNFVFNICGCQPSWTMDAYLNEQFDLIAQQAGSQSVFLLASGGVDSTVAAKVLGDALGPDRLRLLHIDNGLMRKNESKEVLAAFAKMGLSHQLHFVDASETFVQALFGVVEPETKRRIIGETFVHVFQKEAERLGLKDCLLGQGTIYPDTIETGGTRRADTIKTHHNRVPLIEDLIAAGRVIEPLRDLYKVEVRELGEKLGIPHDLLWRHPFPGPGLGVRLLCHDGSNQDVTDLQTQVSHHLQNSDYHAWVLPIRSVGVKADIRSYEHPVLLHGPLSEKALDVAHHLLEHTEGINRCILNLGPQTPKKATPIQAHVTYERLNVLREADHLVMDGLHRHQIYHHIWQCPTVLVPVSLNETDGELVIVRPVHSARAMTAKPAFLPPSLVRELVDSVLNLQGVGALALDLTSKPPGTIEWE